MRRSEHGRWRVVLRGGPGVLGVLGLLAGCGPAATSTAATSQSVPFELPALDRGPGVRLAARPASATVVNFFASWCAPWVTELPLLAAAAGRAGQIRFIGVDVNDSNRSAVRRLLRSAGVEYRIGLDNDGQLADRYHLPGLPDTFFIAADGAVRKHVIGRLTPASLADGLRQLTAGSHA